MSIAEALRSIKFGAEAILNLPFSVTIVSPGRYYEIENLETLAVGSHEEATTFSDEKGNKHIWIPSGATVNIHIRNHQTNIRKSLLFKDWRYKKGKLDAATPRATVSVNNTELITVKDTGRSFFTTPDIPDMEIRYWNGFGRANDIAKETFGVSHDDLYPAKV